MAKVKQWHIHVATNGNVIGKLTNVVLSVALPTHSPSSAEVKERVDLYLYSPSGTSLHVLS
jgi:membrane protein YqaA with SNARE-associated domain